MQIGLPLSLGAGQGHGSEPLNLSAPSLGNAPINQPVSVDLGTWQADVTLEAELLRDGQVVQSNLDGTDITFTAADDNRAMMLRVTGTTIGGATFQVAYSNTVTATYAAPVLVPANVPPGPEIYDVDTGPQIMDVSSAFSGDDLTFVTTGLSAATIDPATGVLSINTGNPISSGAVVVKAQNSGGEA